MALLEDFKGMSARISKELSEGGFDLTTVRRVFAAIPTPRGDARDTIEALKQNVDQLTGASGSVLDKALTLRDLINEGAFGVSVNGTLVTPTSSASSLVVPTNTKSDPLFNPLPTLTFAPVPENLTATATFKAVFVEWEIVDYANSGGVEVWRSTTNTIGTAVKIGQSSSKIFVDQTVLSGVTYYYWARSVLSDGITFSGYNAISGTVAALGLVGNTDLGNLIVTAAKLADGSVQLDKIANGAVGNTKLADLAVTAAKLADGSVQLDKIANGAVGNTKLADLAVTAAKLADGSVEATKIASLAVGNAAIQNAAITNAKIADLAVDTAKIADLAVTEAKIASLAVGNAAIQNAAITNAKIADLAVDTAKIADLAVTEAKIASLAVGNAAIQNAAITNAKIADLAVTEAKIASLAVGNAAIQNAAITNAKIADLAVDTAKIADLAVSEAKIADLAVTNAKIGNLAVGTAQIQDAAINNAKIANLAVNTANIADGAITSAKIGDAEITNAKIGGTIQSNVFVSGSDGWRIDKSGTIRAYSGGGYTQFNLAATGFTPMIRAGDNFYVLGNGDAWFGGVLRAGTVKFETIVSASATRMDLYVEFGGNGSYSFNVYMDHPGFLWASVLVNWTYSGSNYTFSLSTDIDSSGVNTVSGSGNSGGPGSGSSLWTGAYLNAGWHVVHVNPSLSTASGSHTIYVAAFRSYR